MKPTVTAVPRERPKWLRNLLSKQFLLVSIAVHLLFCLGATYLVVQNISAKRKLTFSAAPPTSKPSQHAVEHQVQAEKKRSPANAAAQARRIVSKGISKISLPEMPAMQATMVMTASKMGGVGNGMGMALSGNGTGGGSGGAGGGGGLTMFGFKKGSTKGMLKGKFFDLKQTLGRQPTGVSVENYQDIVVDFIKMGWAIGKFSRFYQGPNPVFATEIFIPRIPADQGPAAFGLADKVQPRMWIVHYKGSVSPPESGSYHFVGAGDDVLYVRFNGKLVLDACWYSSEHPMVEPEARYYYPLEHPGGFSKGPAIKVEAGKTYPMEVLIGEQPGGLMNASLLIEKEGVEYQKDEKGQPILPVFRLAERTEPETGDQPPHMEKGPVWSGGEQSLLPNAIFSNPFNSK